MRPPAQSWFALRPPCRSRLPRIRKVKCDESKPYCLRCTKVGYLRPLRRPADLTNCCHKTGRKCDGYLDPSAMASRRRAKDQVPLSALLEWASPDEKRSFHFFQHVTAPCLSGDLDAVFWRVLVLQICQRESAVRHAVLAVSSLHEGLIQGTIAPFAKDSGPRHSFALQQYNKAIACLLGQMNDPSSRPMGPLLTCVLFVCIEFMQSKDKESLIHLEQGRQILSRLERRAASRDPEIEVIKQHLVPMYTRLSMTSFLFGGTPVPIPQNLKTLKEVPLVFESLHEMRYAVHDFLDQVLRFTQRSRPAKYNDTVSAESMRGFETEQRRLLQLLGKLNVAFSLYQAAKPKEAAQTTSSVLQMYLHVAKIWLATALSVHQTTYDEHLASFSAIVPLAASILNAEVSSNLHVQHIRVPAPPSVATSTPQSPGASPAASEPTRPNHTPPIFTFETHIIPALYYVATKCRHPLVRHAALDLLQRNPSKRENLWRADVIGGIAAHVVRVEERWLRRPSSPSNFHPTAPSSTDLSPEQLWRSRLPGLPVPDAFHADVVARSVVDPRVAELSGALAATTTGAPLTPPLVSREDADARLDLDLDLHLGLDMDMDLDMEMDLAVDVGSIPIDPALLLDIDTASQGHTDFSGAASYTSHRSPEMESQAGPPDPGLLFDATSITVQYAAEGTPAPGSSPAPLTIDVSRYASGSAPSVRGSSSGGASDRHPRQSAEAPFDLPEHLRVHDAIIGPEKEDGSWVTVFRKLQGLDADWDVQTEYVRVL